jgi:glycosyltransferase involved in cell wall biosynthesis
MKIVVGSLKFSPVFKSHCLALGRQCEINGFDVTYIFSNNYKYLIPEEINNKCIFFDTSTDLKHLFIDYAKINNNAQISKLFSIGEISYIYMFNYHPLNRKIAKNAKKYGIKYIQHVHEVSVDPTNYRFPYGHLVKASYEYLMEDLLKMCDTVVVSSDKIFQSFGHKYKKFAKIVKSIPLIYADIEFNCTTELDRNYITFVGPSIPTKNIELFYKIIDHSIDAKLDYSYLIISREYIELPENVRAKTRLYYKKKISDEEIEHLLLSSIAMIVPYKNISQSSNVNTAYRCGTPVIASNIPGLRQFVFPGKTGCLVNLDAPIKCWTDSISYVSDNLDQLSDNCKRYYEDNFAEKNWNKYLADIFR